MKNNAVIILLLMIFIQILSANTDASISLDGKWSYCFSDSSNLNWHETTSPTINRSWSDPKIIYLKTKLPDKKINNPALFIDYAYQSLSVFYKNSLIYSSGDLSKDKIAGYRAWHLINLPADFQNREIVFKIRSGRAVIGLSEYIFIDSAEIILQNIFKKDLVKLLCAAFLILFSLIALFLTIYLKEYVYIGLCGFILMIGIWIIANQHLSQIYFNFPTALYYMDIPALIFALAGFFHYFKEVVIDKYRRITVFLWVLYLSTGIFSIILDLFTPLKIDDNSQYYLILLLTTSIILTYILLKKPLKDTDKANVFIIGVASCSSLAGLETIMYLFQLNPTLFGLSFSFLHVGTVLLVLFWAILMFLKYVEAYHNYIAAHDLFSKRILDLQNEERKRIAADLHDAIGHDFLVIKTLSETGKNSSAQAKEMLSEISTVSEQGVNNVRAICRALYPPVLENIGLTQALKSLIKRSFNTSGYELSSNIEDTDSCFAKNDYIHVYRIVQEIINNIIKHAGANTVKIELYHKKDQVVLQVADNGKGIEQSVISNITLNYNSFGLSGILERVKILKGTAEITNNKPTGLMIRIVFPSNQMSDI